MGWRKVQIKEFLTPREERYKPDDPAIAGMLRIEKIDFTGKIIISDKPSKTDMIVVHPGDFVISGINVSKGAMAVYQGNIPVKATIHYSSYKVDHSVINLEYFKRFLKSPVFIRILKEQMPGGIKTEIKPKHLMPLVIDLPELPEQEAILSRFLNTEEEYVELTGEIANQKALLKKYRQAILQEAIQGKLTEDWRKENPDVEPAAELLKRIAAEKAELVKQKKIRKQKPLSPIKPDEIPFDIPESWQWCRLGALSDVKVGATPPKENSKFWGGKAHWVSSGEVANNLIFDTKEKITSMALSETSAELNPKGSVLVAMIGQGKTRGQTAILSIDAATNQNVAAIRYFSISSEYIWYFFLSQYEKTRSGASGGSQPALNGIKIKNTVFPLPPLVEQQKIVRRVESKFALCDALEVEITVAEQHAEQLSTAILQELFDNQE